MMSDKTTHDAFLSWLAADVYWMLWFAFWSLLGFCAGTWLIRRFFPHRDFMTPQDLLPTHKLDLSTEKRTADNKLPIDKTPTGHQTDNSQPVSAVPTNPPPYSTSEPRAQNLSRLPGPLMLDRCAICGRAFVGEMITAALARCGHPIHSLCLEAWMLECSVPSTVCRNRFDKDIPIGSV